MNLRYFWLLLCCVCLFPILAQAAPKAGAAAAKVDQDVIRQAAKLGLTRPQVRELSAALKQDRSIGQAVQGAIDNGLRGRELADFFQNEIKKRQRMMGQQQDMGQGMMGQMGQGQMGQGQMGQGMMGQGPGMGQGMGMGMNGGGMGMGRGMGGRGMGMGPGMGMGRGMGGRGMGMGKGGGSRGGR